MLSKLLIDKTKSQAKNVRLSDGRGMYLEITPNGGKWWRFKYRIDGKEKRISLGVYPDVGLAEARDKREQARKLLAAGVDPGEHRKAEKIAVVENPENTFQAVAREWFDMFSKPWAKGHADKIIRRLELYIFPWLGARPIKAITAQELLAVLRRIEGRGANETAHRAMQVCGRVFRYAVATGRAERDPSRDLSGALAPVKEKHLASITDPQEVGALLRAIDAYNGEWITRCALRLAPLVFVRPGELRHARWSEIDFDKAEWRIPAARMEMRVQHIVPLSTQAIAVLRDLEQLTRKFDFAFPGTRSRERPMSENTVTAALRRMGYGGDEMTGHGFRSMASTLLNEQGWNRDAIERQLAHGERDAVRAAYNYAQHLAERRIEIVYIRLASPQLALSRIASRVRQGGHDLPRADVIRRFKRGWTNFLDVYQPLADHWAIYENSESKPRLMERAP
jgi:integrase